MDDFLFTWLISLGFVLVIFAGILLAVHFNKNVDEEVRNRLKSRIFWLKSVCCIFCVSVVVALFFTVMGKLDVIGIIILIGLPGALISILGKK